MGRPQRSLAFRRCRRGHETHVTWVRAAVALRERSRYELKGRGVRVISGRSEDVDAADSNGAGKSALVMAPAWALTGRSDARAEVWPLAEYLVCQHRQKERNGTSSAGDACSQRA